MMHIKVNNLTFLIYKTMGQRNKVNTYTTITINEFRTNSKFPSNKWAMINNYVTISIKGGMVKLPLIQYIMSPSKF